MSCVFCDRIRDEQYERTISSVVARFEPLNPVTRGHMLFLPKRHVGNAAAQPGLTGEVFAAASAYARERGGEFNLITSAGPCASQTVYHLHVHYVPRVLGDGLKLPWTEQRPAGAA